MKHWDNTKIKKIARIISCVWFASCLIVGYMVGPWSPLSNKKKKSSTFQTIKKGIEVEIQELYKGKQQKQFSSEEIKEQWLQLMKAVSADDILTVRVLLDQGTIDLSDKEIGYMPLMVATMKNNTAMAALLLKFGAEINGLFVDSQGEKRTPLEVACSFGNVELASMLINKGASLYVSDSRGFTPFHGACIRGDLEIVKLLLKSDMNIDEPSSNGTTALMMAVYAGQADMVRFLLQEGADPYLRNKEGNTVLDYAYSSKSPNKDKIIKLLEQL